MMTERWRITLRIDAETAFHTLGPGRTLPLVDRTLQVDSRGNPMIPGSQVRGRVRVHLERLLKASSQAVCSPPRPDRTCPHNPAIQKQLAGLDEPYCLACRIFGSPWREAAVAFGNFYLVRDEVEEADLIAERTSVGISRRLGTAQAERLFTSQTTSPGIHLSFGGPVEGCLSQEELGWLLAAFKLVTHIGGDKARGLGRIALKVSELQRWDAPSRKWTSSDPQVILKEVMQHATL
jgi:CRISPR/Cas system CSM-associated protein Csm3 (group 7 of RAMP superfamily)